jgi:2,4-dienoyl-CoA reductase-like NADH-dependent reductase (Old Yellow Enzyme family)
VTEQPAAHPQFAKLADAVHAHGARQFVQLMVTGVQDKGAMMTEWHPL